MHISAVKNIVKMQKELFLSEQTLIALIIR
jgi:hypothetical protein